MNEERPTDLLDFLSLVLLQHFSTKLTPFEMSEVLDFPKMYFFGQNANKIKGIPWAQNNNGLSTFIYHFLFFCPLSPKEERSMESLLSFF